MADLALSGTKHSGLVVPVGANLESGRARFGASCACGWSHPPANEQNANRALSRHLREVRQWRS